MRVLPLSLVVAVTALCSLAGCDLLTPPPVLGNGERPRGDEGEGDEGEGDGNVAEGEGEEGEGDGNVGEGEGDGNVGEGEGDGVVPGDCEAAVAGAPTAGDAAGGQLDASLDVSVVGATVSLQLFGAHAAGTYDLGSADNANYATCTECVIAFDEAGTQAWFQAAGGTVVLDDDPSAGHYAGSVSGVVLEEVTIDTGTFESSPVVGGSCFDLAGWSFDFTAAP